LLFNTVSPVSPDHLIFLVLPLLAKQL